MTEELFFDGVRYIPAADAAVFSNLTRDYIARLAREGRITGKQIGRQWYVSQESLRTFVVAQEYANSQRRSALMRERQQEYGRSQVVVPKGTPLEASSSSAAAELHSKLAASAMSVDQIPLELQPVIRKTVATSPLAAIMPGIGAIYKIAAATLALVLIVGLYTEQGSLTQLAPQLQSEASSQPQSRLAASSEFVGGAFDQLLNVVGEGLDAIFAPFGGVRLAQGGGSSGVVTVKIIGTPLMPAPAPQKQFIAVATSSQRTVNQTVIENPVVERVVQTQTVTTTGGVTQSDLDQQLQQLSNSLSAKIYSLTAANSSSIAQNYNAIAQTNSIDQLTNTTINSPTITGGSISNTSISGSTISGATFTGTTTLQALAVSGSATSTYGGGVDLSAGCFSINGTCLSTGGAGNPGGANTEVQYNDNGVFNGSSEFTFSAASNTLSVLNASTTNSTSTNGYISSLVAANATSTNLFASAASFTSGIIGSLSSTLASITGLTATNATTTNATTTNLYVSGNTTLANPLSTSSGGSGTSTAPSYGQLLVGNGSGGYNLIATSSLGITSGGGSSSVSTSSQNIWSALQVFAAGASTTQLSVFNNAYFGGAATSSFNSAGQLTLANLSNAILGVNSSGQVVASTSIGTNLLTGSLGTINGTPFNVGGSVTVGSASTTLLANNNTWTGLNSFANATATLATLGTTWFSGISNAILAVDNNGKVIATSSIGTNLLSGTISVSNGGTGIASSPSYGNILVGNGSGGYTLTSTSSLGFVGQWVGDSNGIDYSGNVGIGTSASATVPLFVKNTGAGDGSQFGTVFFGENSTGDVDAFNVRVKDGITDLAADYTGGIDTNLTFSTRSDGLPLTEKARIDNNGNFGIGTTSPGSILAVNGVGNFVNGATSTLYSGLNITSGCFSINGNCISGATGVSTSSQNIWSALQVFAANASTSQFTATSSVYFTSITNGLLATNQNGQVVATTSVGTNYLVGSLGTINGTNFNIGGSITVSAASSTLLSNNNTWTGLNSFANATSTLTTLTTAWFSGLASAVLAVDQNGKVIATSTIGTNLLSGNLGTVNGQTLTAGGSVTIAAASSTLLANNNTFSGNNLFSASTTFSNLININQSSTSLATLGSLYLPNLTNAILSTNSTGAVVATTSIGSGLISVPANSILAGNASGQIIASTSIGTNLLTGNLGTVNGQTLTAGGTITVASTTLLANSNTFSGNNLFSASTTFSNLININQSSTSLATVGSLYFSSLPNAILSTNSSGQTVATTSIGTNYLVGTLGTVNGQTLTAGGSITVSAASSTLLSNNNTWTGLNSFANATSTLTTLSTTWFSGLASAVLAVDQNGKVIATSSIGTNLLSGNLGTVNGQTLTAGGSITVASTTLLANNNTFTGRDIFSLINLSATSSSILATDANGNIIATTTIGTNLLSGNLATINGQTLTAGGSITVSSTTLLANNNTFSGSNTFSGTNVFSKLLNLSATTSALLATDANGNVIATTSVGTNYLTGSLGTINGTNFNIGGSITVSAASSTLLSNNNTWTGLNSFANATSTLTTLSTTWFSGLASAVLAVDNNGKVIATSTIGTNLLSGNLGTVNGQALTAGGSITVTAASSTLLSNNNTFSGNNLFSASTTFSSLVNIGSASTSLATFGSVWLPSITSALLSTNANGQLVATTSIGTNLLTGTLGISNGGTGTSTAPNYGQILVGNSNSGFNYVATSSLGLLASSSISGSGVISYNSGTGVIGTQPGTFGGSGTYTFPGDILFNNATSTGNIVPSVDNTYTLGSPSYEWKSVYIGPGSLFVNGQEVVHTDVGDDVVVTASSNQNLIMRSAGSGSLELNSSGTGNIQLAGPTQITGGDAFTTSNGTPVLFTNGTEPGNLELTNNTIQAVNTNGGISISPAGNGGTYITNGNVGIGTTNPGSKLEVQGTIAAQNFSATSTTATSTFANGINVTGGCVALSGNCLNNVSLAGANTWTGVQTFANASSTLTTLSTAWFSGLASAVLAVDQNGKVIATSTIGTNLLSGNLATINGTTIAENGSYTISAASSTLLGDNNVFSGNNVFSNLLSLTNGLISSASSTIGSGTQAGGLTINGGATTTGNSIVSGTFNAAGKTTLGNASTTVLSVSGNSYLGTGLASTFAINSIISCSGSQALQTDGSGNISCGAINVSGASSGGGWTTNNNGRVALSTTTDLVAVGATTTPYAKLTVLSGSNATTTLALVPASAQTANILDIYAPGGGLNSVITAGGSLGIGTTSPLATLSVGGSAYITGTTTLANVFISNATTTGSAYFTSLSNAVLAVDNTGKLVATSSIGTNLLTGNLGTVNGQTLTAGGSITVSAASSTLLSNNNTWTGLNSFTNATSTLTTLSTTWFSGLASAVLAVDQNGKVIATSTIGTNLLSGNLATINGTTVAENGSYTIAAASSTLLANNNTFSGNNLFSASTTFSNLININQSSTSLATLGSLYLPNLTNAILSTNSTGAVVATTSIGSGLISVPANSILAGNASGQIIASTSIGTNLLTGNLGTVNGQTLTAGGTITVASTTLLANNNTFSGINVFSKLLNLSATTSALLATDANGNVIATTSVGTNYLTGSLGSINGTPFSVGSSITVSSASTTLLANNNTWTGLNSFSNATNTLTTLGTTWFSGLSNSVLAVDNNGKVIATSTIGTNLLSGNLGTVNGQTLTAGGSIIVTAASSTLLANNNTFSGTDVFSKLLNLSATTSALLATDANGNVIATTSIGTNYLTGNLATINGTTVAENGTYTISAASSTLLANNNTFSGNNLFSASTTFSNLININQSSTSLATLGTTFFSGVTNALLSTNNNGQVVATSTIGSGLISVPANSILAGNSSGQIIASTSIGTNLLTGNLGTVNGQTLTAGGSITVSSTTLLANNNTFSGTDVFSKLLNLSATTSALLATDANGNVIATTTIGTGLLSGNLGTVNGQTLTAGGSITVSAASSTLLSNNNTWTGLNMFANASSTLTTLTTTWFSGLSNSILAVDNNGKVIATSTIGTNLLSGNIGTVNGQTLTAGGSITVTAASSTLLANNNTFTGRNTFSLVNLSATSSSLLATDANGNVIATTTIGTNLLSANTISGVTLGGTLANLSAGSGLSGSAYNGSATQSFSLDVTHANNWTGLQTFQNASSTNFSNFANAYFGGSATSSFNSAGQLTLAGLASAVLGVNSSGQVVATSTIGTNLLTGNLGTVNGQTLTAGGSITVTAASSTLLANNNTFSGTDVFSKLLNLSATTSALLATDANGNVIATSSIGTNLLTGNLGTINGQTLTAGGTITVASTTLLANNNTFSGNNLFSASTTFSNLINVNQSSTSLATIGSLYFSSLPNAVLSTNASGQTVATTSIGTNYLTGTLGTINGQTLTVGGTITVASTTLLANNNTFSGTNVFSKLLNLSATTSALLATDQNGNVIATTSIGTNYLTGNLGTINGQTLTAGGSVTVSAASSTLLANNNTWTGLNSFANATSTLTTLTTAWFSGLASAVLAVDQNGKVIATSTIGTNLLTGNLGTVNGQTLTAGGSITVTAASSTLLSNNNTFSGTNLFSASTTFSNLININQSSTSLATVGSLYFSSLPNAVLSTNASGAVVATTSIGTNYLTGTLGMVNGQTLTVGGSITVASTTLLANNNTFSGTDVFSKLLNLSATTSALLATDANGNVIATTSIGTGLLSGNLGTINGQTLTAGGTITVASTTLLANNNTFSGTNIFSNTLTLTNGFVSQASSTIVGTLTATGGLTVGNATSTFANGITLSSGCVYYNGSCIGANSGTVNAGTQGQFPYYATTGTTLTATSTLFLTQSGQVGIGTTTPGIVSGSNKYLTIASQGGASDSRAALELAGNTNSGSGTTGRISFFNQVGWSELARISAVGSGDVDAGNLTFSTGLDGTVNEVARFDSAGNFGIGTTSPGSIFSVQGVGNFVGGATSTLYNGLQVPSISNSGATYLTGITNGLLSTNANGQVVATSTIGTNLLTGTLGTVNGQTLTAGGSITVTAASSTLLSNNNTWTGLNSFANATSTLTTLSTTWFSGISNAILAVDQNGKVIATSTIGTNLLSGNLATINGTTVAENGTYTISAASSTLLANNNTFSGNNVFSASTTFSNVVNLNQASSSLATLGTTWFSGLASAVLAVDNNGKVIATSTIGTNLLSGNLGTVNGQTLTAGGSITVASTTLLSNNNTFSGSNTFSSLLNLTSGLLATASSTIGNGTSASGLTINGGATTTGLTIFQGGYIDNASSTHTAFTQFTNASTTQFTNSGNTYLTGITNGVLSTNNSGQVVATTSVGTNYLTGSLGSINGTNFNVGGSITVSSASSTLLSNNNTWTGLNSFSNASSTLTTLTTAWFSGLASAVLAVDNNGKVIATSTIGTNLLSGNLGTINGQTLTAGGSVTVTAASSTLLANNNTFSGNNVFSASTTFSNLININQSSTSLATLGTSWFTGLATFNGGYIDNASSTHTAFTQFTNASTTQFTNTGNTYLTSLSNAVLGVNSSGQVVATSTIGSGLISVPANSILAGNASGQIIASTSIGTNLLTGTLGTVNGQTLTVGGTITVASTTLLANNNTFSGNNVFSASTTFSNVVNINQASTSLETNSGSLWLTGLTASSLLAIDNNGKVIASSTIGSNLISGVLGTINGVSFSRGGSITVASTTLLANNNTWTGLNSFANATSTLTTLSTTWFSGLASAILAVDQNGKVIATSTIGTNLLSGNLATINGTTVAENGTYTISAASSTLLANNNTFSGNNVFSAPLVLSATIGTTTIASGQGFTVGGSQFVVQQGSGNVGIGTSSPSSLFNLYGGNFVQNASSPIASSTIKSIAGANKVYIQGRYAYITTAGDKLYIVDISNPLVPNVISSYTTLSNAESIWVSGKYAYIGENGAQLEIVDVSDAASPSSVGTLSLSADATSVYLSGQDLVIAEDGGQFEIADISDPASPSILSTTFISSDGNPLKAVQVVGKYAYLAGFTDPTDSGQGYLNIYDISDPTNPVFVGSDGVESNLNASGLYVSGNYAYLAMNGGGLYVTDISDPTAPADIATVGTTNNAQSVTVAGNYAYVGENATSNGLEIYDVSTPSSPVRVGSFNLGKPQNNGLNNIAIAGKYLYVPENGSPTNGFQVMDINGIQAPAASIGAIDTNQLTVDENANIGGDLTLNGGISTGAGGIFSRGGLSIVGTSTFGGPLTVNSTATSSFANGIDLPSGGCFSIGGTCIGTSAASSTLLSDNNRFTGGNLFLASTTIGNGNQNGGLTINGGATTTGNIFTDGNIQSLGNVQGFTGTFNGGVSGGLNNNFVNGYFSSWFGIGTTSSFALLGIAAPAGNTGPIISISTSTVGATSTAFTLDSNGSILSKGAIQANSLTSEGGVTALGNISGLGATFATGAFSGSIGIGTTTPWANLGVQALAGQTNPLFQIASSSIGTSYLTVSATGFGTTTLSGLSVNGSATSTSNVGFNLTGGCFAINGTCLGSGSSASTTLLANNNMFSGNNVFSASTTFSNLININQSSSSLATVGSLYFSNLGNAVLSTNSTGQVVATTSIGTNYLTGSLGSINGTNFNVGGSITVTSASSTLLGDNNTFSGTDIFSNLLNLNSGLIASASSTIGSGTQTGGLTINGGATTTGNSIISGTLSVTGKTTLGAASTTNFSNSGNSFLGGLTASSLLALNNNNQIIASSSIGTNLLTGTLGTINGTTITANTTNTITAASSTLLSNNNTFSGNNVFSASTTFSNLININQSSTSLATLGTTWFSGLASAVLGVNNNGQVVATSSFGTNLLTGTLGTINGTAFNVGSSITVSSTTLLANNNTFSGNDVFSASTTFSNLININQSSTSLATLGSLYLPNLTNAILSTNSTGAVVATTSIGTNYLTGVLGVANGGTGWANITAGDVTFGNGSSALGTSSKLFFNSSSGFLGVGTSNPYAQLTVSGGSTGNALEIDSTGIAASTTLLTVSNAGLVSVGADQGYSSGIFTVDASSSTTTISNLSVGNLLFDTDAGIVNLSDIPVDSNAAAGVQEAQIINIGGNPLLTASGIANGSGSVTNLGVAIGATTTPWALLSLWGPDTSALTQVFSVANNASTTLFDINDLGNVGIATSSPTTLAGFSVATTSYFAANVGIGTTTPGSALSVAGNGYFTGNFTASGNTILGSATTTNLFSTTASSTNLFSQLASVGTLSLNNLASAVLGVNSSGQVVSTSTIGTGLLSGTLGTINGTTFAAGTSITVSSTTLLANNNTFSGNNLFSASTTFSTLANIGNASTSLATFGSVWLPSVTNAILSTNSTGAVVATTSIGVNYLSGVLPIANGGTNVNSQTTNGVNYFNGTSITSGTGLTFTGQNLGIGTTTPFALLSLSANNGNAFPGNNLFSVSSSTANSTSTLFSIDNQGRVVIGQNTAAVSSSTQLSILAGTTTAVRVSTDSLSTVPASLFVQGNYAYIRNNNLEVWDISNPSAPTKVGSISDNLSAEGIYVQGKYAYVDNQTLAGGFQIFDVSNPASPFLVSSSTLNVDGRGIYVSGRYAYLVDQGTSNSFEIWDVSNPYAPVRVSSSAISSAGYGISVQGQYAYLSDDGSATNAFEVWNISNPAAPVRVFEGNLNGFGGEIYTQGRYAYIVDIASSNNFEIWDISNPASPVRVSQSTLYNEGQGISVQGRYAYIQDFNAAKAFEVWDVSNPAAPVRVSLNTMANTSLNNYPTPFVQGRYAYLINDGTTNGLEAWDLGGAYIQQLEAGGLEAGTLVLRNNLQSVDGEFSGGLTVGQSLSVTGSASIVGASSTIGTTNSIFSVATASSTNPILTVTGNGNVGVGTTTPFWALTAASSTGPQLALVDTTGASNAWTFRSISNTLYIATSTASATSTNAALSFNGTTGAATFGSPATTTFTGGILATDINETGSATSTFVNGINVTGGCFSINGTCVGGSGGGVSLSVQNTWSALQLFQAGASTTALSVYGPAYFGTSATSSFNTLGQLTLNTTNTTANSLLSTNSSGLVVATSTIGWNLLQGPASSIFAFNSSGVPIATTSIGTNYITGVLGSINGTSLSAGGSITIASTTLLANNNTFSGNNLFSASTTFSNLININQSSTSLATLGTTWFTGLTNSSLLAIDNNGKVIASSTIGFNLLKGPASSIFAFDNSGNPIATTSIGVNYLSGILAIANGGTNANSQTANGVSFFNGTSLTTGSSFVFTGTNVGVGTTSPQAKFEVSSNSAASTTPLYLSNFGNATDSTEVSLAFRTDDITHSVGTTTGSVFSIFQGGAGGVPQLANGDLGFATLQSGLLTEVARITSAGKFGVGTTSPTAKFSITNTVTNPQLAIAYDTGHDFEERVDSAGGLNAHASGGNDYFVNDNLWTCTGGTNTTNACPSGSPTGEGNLIVANKLGIGTTTLGVSNANYALNVATQDSVTNFMEVSSSTSNNATFTNIFRINSNGNVLIGTTSAPAQLSVGGLLYVGANSTASVTMGTATSTFNGDVKILGKLDVGTIDPVYTIDGTKYATYGESGTGEHEETTQTIELTQKDPTTGKYTYTIDFDTLDEASDLWLFYQITDFGPNWQNLVVLLTPSFDGTVFYNKLPGKHELQIEADQPGEVSMRLTGNRFDYSQWGNVRPDQNDTTEPGFILPLKADAQPAAAALPATLDLTSTSTQALGN